MSKRSHYIRANLIKSLQTRQHTNGYIQQRVTLPSLALYLGVSSDLYPVIFISGVAPFVSVFFNLNCSHLITLYEKISISKFVDKKIDICRPLN